MVLLWKRDINKAGISLRYKNDIYKFLRSILNFGVKWHGFNFNNVYNKMTKFQNPNERRKEMSYYNYEEFKKFISRGNVIDMAVGVIIGSAFSKIVTSLVQDLLMPVIGVVLGGLNFSDLSLKIGSSSVDYGLFVQSIVDFLIISLSIFIMIKIFSKFKRKEEKKEDSKKTEEVLILEDIRDLLKNNLKEGK